MYMGLEDLFAYVMAVLFIILIFVSSVNIAYHTIASVGNNIQAPEYGNTTNIQKIVSSPNNYVGKNVTLIGLGLEGSVNRYLVGESNAKIRIRCGKLPIVEENHTYALNGTVTSYEEYLLNKSKEPDIKPQIICNSRPRYLGKIPVNSSPLNFYSTPLKALCPPLCIF